MSLNSNMIMLLKRRGISATLRVSTSEGYDPSTGTNTVTTQDYEVKAYFAQAMTGEDNTGEVAYGSRFVCVSPVDASGNPIPKPDTKDVIVGVDDQIVVTKTQIIRNNSTVVCYLCYTDE